MDEFNGPGPSRGRARRGGGGRRPRHGGAGAGPPRGPRASAQPPPERGRRGARQRGTTGQGVRGERTMEHHRTDDSNLQRIVENYTFQDRQNDGNNAYSNHTGNKKKDYRDRLIGFKMLEEISQSDSAEIIEKINQNKKSFTNLLETPLDKKKDVFALIMELVKNVWKCSFEESKKLLLLEICNSKFIDHLQLYLMQLPYTDRHDKHLNTYYWTRENEFWENFLTFCEIIINVSPSTAVRRCGSLIEATSKSCLEGLKEKHTYDLPVESALRMTKIRDSLKTCDEEEPHKQKARVNEMGEPLENFRELSILPTRDELMNRRPYLRANVVDGAYADTEHYLDVQFRLLREDCFGPLREGIHQFIEQPKKTKYDHIRVYHNVKFLEPFVSKQKIGSVVMLDENTMKKFKKVNWAHSKRFLFGSLVLFTKDHCKNFLIGTILERDEKYLKKGQLPVNIVNLAVRSNIYNDDSYTMIESEVYFEPYHHVLKTLQDPNFPRHIAMSDYIVDLQKVPKVPAYLSPDAKYLVETNHVQFEFTVLQEDTWPTQKMLGFDTTQYDAYKLALTHEFAVIQGPPGTGKTFLGVKIAETLLKNLPFDLNRCRMLIVCYTNHALDQFMEALLPITQSMARIGGRSRNEALENININKLRRAENSESSSFHQSRINLKSAINALEHAQARLDALHTGVLSYNSVVAYSDECKVIEKFYRGRGIEDPLKHWLFEDTDNIEFEQLLPQHIAQEKEVVEEDNIDIDDRQNLIIDDFGDDDVQVNWRDFDCIRTSFSLSDTEEEIKELLKKFQNSWNAHDPLYKQRELQDELCYLYSQVKLFKDMLPYRSRSPTIQLTNTQDITTIQRIDRWCLYFKWIEVPMQVLQSKIGTLQNNLKVAAEIYEEARMMADLAVLKSKDVVGMTTSGAARLRKLLIEIAPPIVVVEEAAEVLEAHIVTALTRSCQHLILIGDHQQLRPSAAYMKLARFYNIEVSLFERMIVNGVHSRRLGVQHRMRPAIAALVSPHIYPDLKNHPSVEEFPPVRGVADNLFFYTHDHPEENEDDSTSRVNTHEADMVLRLANYLMQQDYRPEDVTILSAYSGQMFYMRKQRPLYTHLSNVKITVLDNYQGEESKIILLSLVRNNSNSIGFLGTENRVCVALSRAREGFYIFGNIELLKKNSTLWANVAKTLSDNGSLGTSLTLKCPNHSDQLTMIKSLNDYAKVPEGGCLMDCKHCLPCGHACPRICHGYDLVHATIKCTKDCDRKICEIEDHNCPLKCAQKCQPCERLVLKSLPCGHAMMVPCHKEPGDPSVFCTFTVSVTLPDCGHETDKPCSMKTADVRCKEKCQNSRLVCGHACRRTCHVADDPDHERYTCMQPCPKAKKGCTANLEDLGEHKCLRSCFEECLDCNVQVVKKRSGCRHSKRVACHESVDQTPCREKCARSLPCGHHCKKLCFEPCGDCQQRVKKSVPECGHEIDIACGAEPTRAACGRACERVLGCGHACARRCGQPCDRTECTRTVDHALDSPCGHKVRLPCNVYETVIVDGYEPERLLWYCAAPCGAPLRCGHACGGSCGACRQGRLHAPCAAVCHQLNICGHRCEEPCNQVCPPCKKRCERKCQHSACSRPCGEPCPPCAERECSRACKHSRCSRACGAPCDREPCALPCPELQACGHRCRGVCGEPCPRACNVCDPDHFPTDLLGDPYEEDDMLVQLQDCPHILDVDNLDTLMKSQTETIQIKGCPFCRQPIVNTHRYKDIINKFFKDDFNPIKEKVYGSLHQRLLKRDELKKKAQRIREVQNLAKKNKYWKSALEIVENAVQRQNKNISLLHLEMFHIYLNILENVGAYYIKYTTKQLCELKSELESQVKLICVTLSRNKQKISQQQQADIGNELKRLNSIVQLATILDNICYKSSKTVTDVAKAATDATAAVVSWRSFDEGQAVECLTKLQNAVKLSGIVGKEERDMVVKAIGLKAGHWFKCPNGHYYCIGECGGAMQLAKCPDCGAAIGGTNHALTAGNQHAREMDGSQFAAWSQEAHNMANYHLD